MMARVDETFWELKESAKWSLDVRERRRAIKQLAAVYGPEAIQSIAEIRDVAAYDEIRDACIEAIKHAARGRMVRGHSSKGEAKTGRKTKKKSRTNRSKKRTGSQ